MKYLGSARISSYRDGRTDARYFEGPLFFHFDLIYALLQGRIQSKLGPVQKKMWGP